MGNITEGKLDNIRLQAGNSQSDTFHPWATSKQAIANSNATAGKYTLFGFSAACWYFAEALTYRMQAEVEAGRADPSSVVPLGLISTAIGGSMIEEWTTNTTTATCSDTSLAPHNQALWDEKVVPFLNMTVKGFLWYQGENNMHGVKGNSVAKTGYGCQMPAMIDLWRAAWSAEKGTTDPNAPFGLVVLPGSGSEGGPNMGAMNWAQTANYGVTPNPAMPNVFSAQAYDLNDPWGDKSCYGMQCCWNNYNATACTSALTKKGFKPTDCVNYCSILQGTNVYMGGIHPRIKKPVGYRLAAAAIATVYNVSGAYTGPTIAGCDVSGAKLTVKMDPTLLAGGSVTIQANYNRSQSPFQVLTNASLFCTEAMVRCSKFIENGTRPLPPCKNDPANPQWNPSEVYCPPGDSETTAFAAHKADVKAGLAVPHVRYSEMVQGHGPPNPYETAWKNIPVDMGADKASVEVDLAGVDGTVAGIRYAWGTGGQCCMGDANGITIPCPIETCPIMSAPSNLPANPFMAKVVGGKCKCIPPQKCDA